MVQNKVRLWSVAIVFIMALLGGCSSNLVYNNLDWLVDWYIDDFVDLNSQQKNKLDKRLGQLLFWHRNQELGQYQALLVQLKSDVSDKKLSSDQWLEYMVAIRNHWLRTRDKVGFQLSQMATELSANQVAELFENMQLKNQDEEAEFNDQDAEDIQEEHFENIFDTVKDQLGSVNALQEQAIIVYVQQWQSTTLEYLAYNRRIQADAKATFESSTFEKNQPEDLSRNLYQLLTHPQQYESSELQKMIKSNRALSAQLLQKIHASITPEQQSQLNDNIQEMIELLEELIKGG